MIIQVDKGNITLENINKILDFHRREINCLLDYYQSEYDQISVLIEDRVLNQMFIGELIIMNKNIRQVFNLIQSQVKNQVHDPVSNYFRVHDYISR